MVTKLIALNDALKERCRNYAQQVIDGYAKGDWPESRFYSTHNFEKNFEGWFYSKMAECAFAVWCGYSNPEDHVQWLAGPDNGGDVPWRGWVLDVKSTKFTSRHLLWPANKVRTYDKKIFDALVLMKHTHDDQWFPAGWATKRQFKEQHRVVSSDENMTEGNWVMHEDKLRPMSELIDLRYRAGFVGYDKDGHFVHYCHCGEWGAFGFGVSQLRGKLGTWYCAAHKPQPEPPKPEPERQEPAPLEPTQGSLF